MDNAIDVEPLVTCSANGDGSLAPSRSHPSENRLEAAPRFVLIPHLDGYAGCLLHEVRNALVELFFHAICSSAEAAAPWRRRGRWTVKPSRRK